MDAKKLKELRRPLRADEIDFRVQSINKGGYATILAYKDARADQNRLDEVFGPLGWQRSHSNGNANCVVSVWNSDIQQWVSKEDTGTASNTEAAKGLASDSFKRACFNWGIGRELYDYPVISIKLNDDEWQLQGDKPRQTWNLKIRDWVWKSLFDGETLVALAAIDDKGNKRFSWKNGGHELFLSNLNQIKQMYGAADAEALTDAVDAINNADESMMDRIWRAMDSKERAAITSMINNERKQRKEEQA